jgi:arachidonate 15-lipoxygenase
MPAPPIGALPVALRLRFLIVKCLLLFAAAFARVMRPLSKARRPPGGTVCLPKDDSDPAGRARETEQALSEYPLVSMSERFALDCPRWPHLTVPLLPPRERYPALMFIPKAAVRLALSVDLSTEARWASADAPRSLYWPLRAPEAAQTADDDARFVRWRLQGPNAGWLRRCSSPEAMRAEGASSATLARVAPRDSDLADLYVVNHHPLLNALPTLPGRHLAGAMAFFRREADGSLKPAGIQLTGCDGRVVFFSPDDGAAWKLARSWFQCADMHVHEAVSHFLWTHIVGEKFLLATARRLPWRHPVRRFLAPHFEFTLNANYNSGTALVGFNGIFERAFSAGWRGTGGLIQRADLIWHFDRMILPRQIAARDVAGIADYPCRDDALLIWNALEEHAAAYVDLWYPSDDAVRTDPEIRSWSEELHGWIGDRGFPAVEDRPTLRVVLAAVLFNDVQHTLVNALQYDAFAYPPAWPSSMWEPPPSGDISSSVAEGLLLSSLPPVRQTLEAIRATYAFSIQFNMLGRGLRRYHSGPSLALMDRLQDRLKEVTKVIEQRNAKRSHPYRIALPARVSNSINA